MSTTSVTTSAVGGNAATVRAGAVGGACAMFNP